MKNHRLTAYMLLLATSVIWGFAGPIIKFTLQYFPPSVFLTYRFAISTIAAFLTFLLFPHTLPKKAKSLPHVILYGFLTSTVTLGLLFIGFNKTTALTGSLLGAISPIMVVAAGALFLKEHVTKLEKIGITIAFLGTVGTVLEPLLTPGASHLSTSFVGNLYHMASLAVGVATAILAKLILRDSISPMALTHISFIIGFATMLPATTATHTYTEMLMLLKEAPLAGHLGVLYMGLLSGTLAYTFWHIGQKTIEIGETSLFAYFMPIFAAPLSVLWLHEKITPGFAIGALFIALGVIIAEMKSKKKFQTQARTYRRKH